MFGAYKNSGMAKNGYAILSNFNAEDIKRIPKDPYRTILPVRYYLEKLRVKAVSISIRKVVVTIIMSAVGSILAYLIIQRFF